MKKAVIAILVVLALGVTGCSVGTGASGLTDELTAGISEGDASNPFTFEPNEETEDDISDGVVVENSDEAAMEDEDESDVAVETSGGPIEITTDPGTLLAAGDYGQSYEEEVRATGGSLDTYEWSAQGLPAGLELVPVFGGKRVLIQGELGEAGAHDITITAADPNDSSNKDSITYQLEIESIAVEFNPPEDISTDTGELRIEVLEVGNHTLQGGRGSKVSIPGAGIGGEEWVRLRVTGGNGPYIWSVVSRVDDSYHRINEGGTIGTQQMSGITNYRYWDPGEPCTTPEEIANLMNMATESFWPDCSDFHYLTYDEKDLCGKIGCSEEDWPTGAYGSPEYEHAQQCINGFECPDDWNSPLLTDGQKEACREYHYWKRRKEQALENKFVFDCRWTKNPTWRLQGEPEPEPDQINPSIFNVGSGDTVTFEAEMEYDGPLPVDKSKNKIDGKDNIDFMPVEKVVFKVRDSSSTPRTSSVEVDLPLIYPNEKIDEIKTKVLYRDLNLDWNCNDGCKLKLVLLREKPESDADWSDYEADALAIAEYDLKVFEQENPECNLNALDDDAPLCTEYMDITDLTGNVITDVGHVALHVFTGYHQETHSSADGVEWHYGDMNVEDLSFNATYYKLEYDDDAADDLMHWDISKGQKGTYDLSDTEGIDEPNSKGGSFHRRALIRNKWTF
jgi:hypothetical protein